MEKQALRRIVSELAKGLVKTPLENLAAKGFIKSEKTYAKGMRLGNAALSKLHKAPISANIKSNSGHLRMISQSSGGAFTIPHISGPKIFKSENQINASSGHLSRSGKDLNTSLGIRHELHESSYVNKVKDAKKFANSKEEARHQLTGLGLNEENIKNNHLEALPRIRANSLDVKPTVISNQRFMKMKDDTIFKVLGMNKDHLSVDQAKGFVENIRNSKSPVGSHMNLGVIGKESNDIRTNPYLRKLQFPEYRKVSGEAAAVKAITGKKYGADKITKKDLKKLESPKQVEIDSNGNKELVLQKIPKIKLR